MPQSGLYGFPTDAIVLNQIFDSGSGRWLKPQGLIGRHTVIVRTWGGGGSGPLGANEGGGGGFNQRSFSYEDFPASVEFVVGTGGVLTQGGDSYVVGEAVDVAATGGANSAGGGIGGKPAFRYGGATCIEFDFPAYNGGLGGGTSDQAHSVWGGAAGLAAGTNGAKSIHGGNGGYYNGTAPVAAAVPGGGGSGGAGPDDGANGRVQFIIVRGIVLDLMGNVF